MEKSNVMACSLYFLSFTRLYNLRTYKYFIAQTQKKKKIIYMKVRKWKFLCFYVFYPAVIKKFGIIFSIESVLNILHVFINVKNIIRNFL